MSQQPTPLSKKYGDLISEIEKGQIKIPKFQRNFVWSLDKTANLLDSILKSYPIGTFILWETSERLNDIKNIGGFELADMPEGNKVQYVLDGQQRMTSLYAAFKGGTIQKEGEKKITDYRQIFVDLEADIENSDHPIVVTEVAEGVAHITLHEILNFNENLLLIKENYTDEQFTKIHQYSQAFSTYDFSTILLRKEDLDSAIEVFTRINTGGEKLTLFEIMSAKTYDETQNFDMAEKWARFSEKLADRKYNTISSSVILSLLSLVISKNKECKRKTILQLDKQAFIDAWEPALEAIEHSIDYFRAVYRIPVSELLPYDALLVPFSYFFYFQKEKPKGPQVALMEEFFWRMSLSYRYSSSSESKLAQDIRRIDKILLGEQPNYDEIQSYLNSPQDLIETNFSAGSSFCKAVLALLAYQEPKDFTDNGKIILDNSWLRMANSKNYHHFFPKSYLKKRNIGNENSIVNITLVGADLNKRKIGAKPPSVYVQGFYDENEQLPSALKSHLIDDINSFGVLGDDYGSFLQKRAEAIFKQLENRVNLNHRVAEENPELKTLILGGEDENLEIKSTLRYDIRQEMVNKKLEYVIAKTISAFLNSDGGNLVIGVDDDGNALGLDKDFSTLKKGDTDGFDLKLTEVVSNYIGKTYMSYLKVSFPVLDDKTVCWIEIGKSGKPVFVKHEGKEEFYVRNGGSSAPLSRAEQSEYEKIHWS